MSAPPHRVGRARRLLALRHDHLVTNSFFISLSNASMGALGFAFWVVATRTYRPDQIGVATTLINAAVLIASASLLGFDISFVRFLSRSEDGSGEINTGLTMVFCTAVAVSAAYVVVVPSYVPQLGFLRASPLEAVAVVVFVSFGAVNVVTDSVFIAYRSARFNVLVDGVLQGAIRLSLPALLVFAGTFGLIAAYGSASVAAVVASVVLMVRRFSYRPRPGVSMHSLRRVFRFGAANYLAELFTMLPVLVLPLIIIHSLGSAAAGYFNLDLAIANTLFMAGQAVGQSLLAEGAASSADLRNLALRSAKLQLVVLAAALVVMAAARPILSVFGHSYSGHAALGLVVLAASTPAVGVRNWSVALLRLGHRLRGILAANLCAGVLPCVLAAAWIHHGLVGAALAWLVGNLGAALVAVVSLAPSGAVRSRLAGRGARLPA